ncbi:helix-turn-helix transcriptional regulator [Streptomyces sp. NBC_00151]|uniref:helix-turn-helix transcriptional regulator n=1 Tax=Streptomyces sp. NBC_00151 TaxID=2975669 RepID=UPI002DDBE75F|nr:helix-turn-helix domain-containing protein [Streptomyces sp. NBC_00151]WRZ41864.1 helix-turn-helix domain-containing protein [Streptomyces sp. NBC_00151]
MTTLDPDELLTPAEAALVTKLSVSTLKDKRWKNTGPRFIKLSPGRGGRIRYRRRDLDQWLASGQRSAR